LERGGHAFGAFVAPELPAAIQFATTDYDALVFECEHKPWDVFALRDCLQYLLNRRRIFEAETLAPAVTPLVRIPPNGAERAQWHAKQALDLGFFGVVWPHITSVQDAHNAVAACRYPRLPGADRYEPAGVRGDSPGAAARYWGIPNHEYYRRADVWPRDPDGEILVGIMIESVAAIDCLPAILSEVPGIGLVLIGEGDLSQELGHPREYEHPEVLAHKTRVLDACHARGVAVGHPHVTVENLQQTIEDGYRFLMSAPVTTYPALDRGRTLTGRR
jgi:4-hydroxy-2-oxoheptanedioate aldolase